MTKKAAVMILVVMLFGFPVLAFLGVGDIVHDPAAYANALLMLAELIKNYELLKAQYELQILMTQTVPYDMSIRYRTLGTPWYGLQVPFDRFGNLIGWLQAVNNAGDAFGGYQAASVELHPVGPNFSKIAALEQTKAASHYASLELADGTNIHAMQTVGALRANAEVVDKAIQRLEDDSLSLDPALNTQIAVLNKINAAAIANLRSTRDTNRALLSVVEHQLVQSKLQRDALTSELNVGIARIEHGDAAKAEHTSTITESLRGFRWR
jgi:hypothetical protein